MSASLYQQLSELEMIGLISKLYEYLYQLYVIAFNFGKYDIIVIKSYLFIYFVDKSYGFNDVEEEE